jgi:hypothetical protein
MIDSVTVIRPGASFSVVLVIAFATHVARPSRATSAIRFIGGRQLHGTTVDNFCI